jgi:hypothetical protein
MIMPEICKKCLENQSKEDSKPLNNHKLIYDEGYNKGVEDAEQNNEK